MLLNITHKQAIRSKILLNRYFFFLYLNQLISHMISVIIF